MNNVVLMDIVLFVNRVTQTTEKQRSAVGFFYVEGEGSAPSEQHLRQTREGSKSCAF